MGAFGGVVTRVPTEALSMMDGDDSSRRTIVLIATGERKAKAVQAMLRGPLTTQLPASLLQLHRRVEVYLDGGAAGTL